MRNAPEAPRNPFFQPQCNNVPMGCSEGKLRRLKALANEQGVIAAAAMDHRGALKKALAAARGVDMRDLAAEVIAEFKVAVSRTLTPHASAILLDPIFG